MLLCSYFIVCFLLALCSLSIFLLSSAFCAALLVRYLTSYLLLFSWFVLFQSASLSPFDSILFPPPAALLLLIYGSLLASYSCLDDWIFGAEFSRLATSPYVEHNPNPERVVSTPGKKPIEMADGWWGRKWWGIKRKVAISKLYFVFQLEWRSKIFFLNVTYEVRAILNQSIIRYLDIPAFSVVCIQKRALLHFRTPPIVIDDSSLKKAAESFTVALTLTLGGYESAIAPKKAGSIDKKLLSMSRMASGFWRLNGCLSESVKKEIQIYCIMKLIMKLILYLLKI